MLEEIVKIKRIQTMVQESRLLTQTVHYSEYEFIKINKISLSDEIEKEQLQITINNFLKQFISSFSESQYPIIYRIKSNYEDRSISLYLGRKRTGTGSIGRRFRSYFQAVDYDEVNIHHDLQPYQYQALVTGIPAPNETESIAYVDPIIRFCRDRDVMIEIVAKPVKKTYILQQLDQLLTTRTKNSILLKESSSESTANSETSATSLGQTYTDGSNSGGGVVFVNTGSTTSEGTTSSSSDTKGITETVTKNIEKSEFQAVELDTLLEIYTERLQQALSSGLFKTSISIYTKNKSELMEICDVYKSTYHTSAVEPYRSFPLSNKYETISWNEKDTSFQGVDLFHERFREFSFYTGEELSYVFDIPKEEYNGYECNQAPRFSQNIANNNDIPLGHVYDGEAKTKTLYYLDKNQLVKHLLVAGITGSGKTNTIFNLLKNIDIPFLIIEPAKKEYRALQRAIPHLRVYTLGNEAVSPLRINPFYFPPNVNIQQHIDNLKVIFNASFTMYASMPNILEQCIINVYMKKGWSLTTSKNIYQNDEANFEKYFPTIEDLYYEIDSYTNELGYAEEQKQNIRAALLTRIKSLMTGGKGYMLNTVETMDIGELLRYPTVLELEAVADDDEKSLVIGLISIFIYEYLKSMETDFSGALKHLLVLEEAHRIFANVSQQGSQETVNIKGKAVESLSHILSEIRAYGEGMIIVDQVPTKLASDVLKNTNTKIIHRIVSKDDCEYVSNSLGLSDEKVHFISKLTNGSALFFTDGMSSPAHLQILHGKADLSVISDNALREHSHSYNDLLHYTNHIHPLAEIILQNVVSYEEIELQIMHFYHSLQKDSLQQLQTNYDSVKEKIVLHATNYGFDMNIHIDSFVYSIIQEGLYRIVKTNPKIKKKVNKRIFIERFIDSCLGLLSKDYEIHKKEYTLLKINQQKLGDDYTV